MNRAALIFRNRDDIKEIARYDSVEEAQRATREYPAGAPLLMVEYAPGHTPTVIEGSELLIAPGKRVTLRPQQANPIVYRT